MHTTTPSPELLIDLQRELPGLYPPEQRIATVDALMAHLSLLVPDYHTWGQDARSASVDVLIEELVKGEAQVSLIERAPYFYLLRDIRTTTLYVTTTRPPSVTYPGHNSGMAHKLWLREYKLVLGKLIPRRYPNSMSEKLTRGEHTHRSVVPRMLREELGIAVSDEYLVPPHLFDPGEHGIKEFRYEEPLVFPEIDVHPSEKFPGMLTRNQLGHFAWCMPAQFFREAGYHEPHTNHHFLWEPVSGNQMS